MDLKKAKTLIYMLLMMMIVFAAFCYSRQIFGNVSVIILLLLLAAYIICWAVFWRCPHCGSHLGRMSGARHCKSCGKALYEDEPDDRN